MRIGRYHALSQGHTRDRRFPLGNLRLPLLCRLCLFLGHRRPAGGLRGLPALRSRGGSRTVSGSPGPRRASRQRHGRRGTQLRAAQPVGNRAGAVAAFSPRQKALVALLPFVLARPGFARQDAVRTGDGSPSLLHAEIPLSRMRTTAASAAAVMAPAAEALRRRPRAERQPSGRPRSGRGVGFEMGDGVGRKRIGGHPSTERRAMTPGRKARRARETPRLLPCRRS